MRTPTINSKALTLYAVFASLTFTTQAQAGAAKDGSMAMPADYKQWDAFLSGIEKKSGHIRDIYINSIGAKAQKGQPFADGTVSVMEIYKASGSAGSMTKGELQKVFVMYKNAGNGKYAPAGLQNGDWAYSAFDGKGNKLDVNYDGCRSCHLPLTTSDYIFHYDKYFANQ
ncbi:Cytochrome P460 domain-containing protein [uncultured Thiomicrorhabdus sp.]